MSMLTNILCDMFLTSSQRGSTSHSSIGWPRISWILRLPCRHRSQWHFLSLVISTPFDGWLCLMLWIEIWNWSISRWNIRMSTKLRARFQWPVFGTIPQLMGFRTCRAGLELQNLSWKVALIAHASPSKWRSDWQNTCKQFGYTERLDVKLLHEGHLYCLLFNILLFVFLFLFNFSFFLSLSLSLSLFLSLLSLSTSPPKAYPPLLIFGVWMIWTLLGSWKKGRDGPDHQRIGTHQCDLLCLAVHILWAEGWTFQIWDWRLSKATVLNNGVSGCESTYFKWSWSSIKFCKGADLCLNSTEFANCKHLNGHVSK